MAIEILVPDLPESVADATVATWHKKVGETVKRDEVLVEIETDKVVLEVPALNDGVVTEILQEEGATVVSEQLYPYPHEDVKKALEPYAHVTDYVWCQEEPLNQGAWYCSKHNFDSSLPEHVKLKYAGRPASASPAVGYMSLHTKQQKQLVEDALTL